MKRAVALLGSAIFLVIAPGTLAVYVPWTFTRWRMAPQLFGFSSLRILGGLMIAAGLPVLLDSFARLPFRAWGRRRRSRLLSAWYLPGSIVTCATLCTWLLLR